MSEGNRGRKSKKRLFDSSASSNATITMVTSGMLLSGKYFLKEEIARGGMGVVFLAEDRELENNIVAIKVLPPELSHNEKAQKRLRKEALAAMKLSHPNILRLHSFETDGPTVYLVMEYLNGGTLEDADFFGEMDVDAVLGVAYDICSALDFAHEHGVIHRDIKPANLMLHNVANKRYTKLADLGIAYVVKDSMTRMTNVEAAGTLLYIAPEQLEGKRPSILSDQYSLAASFYEMISGDPPFFGPAVSHQIIHGTPELIEGIPDHINAALQKALSKNPEDRFDCCMDMYRAMKDGNSVIPAGSAEGKPLAKAGTAFADVSHRDSVSDKGSDSDKDSVSEAGSRGEDYESKSFVDSIGPFGKAYKSLAQFGVVAVLLLIIVYLIARTPVKKVAGNPVPTSNPSVRLLGPAALDLYKRSAKGKDEGINQTAPVEPPSEKRPSGVQPTAADSSVAVKSANTDLKSDDPSKSLWGFNTKPVIPPQDEVPDSKIESRRIEEETVDPPMAPLAKPEFINSFGMKFVLLNGGTFMQGSASSGDDDERPKHVVTIKSDFWVSSTEVTNKEYKMVVGKLPSTDYTADNLPVTSVSFNEALEFCRLLTEKEHALSESSKGKYSLPSESQWEYAARGGSTSFSPGDGVWSSSNSGGKPGAVMRFAPNRFGLYDMSGSVWEWTLDYWHPNYEGAPVDGASWDYDGDIDYRVLRGGSWDFPQRNCRYSVRIFEVPYKKRKDVGIRVIFNPSD